jgi:hypothetical protein
MRDLNPEPINHHRSSRDLLINAETNADRVGMGQRFVDQWGTPFMGRATPPSPAGAFCAGSLDCFSAFNPFRHLACVADCVWGGRRDARIKDV